MMKKNERVRRRSRLFLLCSTLMILLAGMVTLLWQLEHRDSTKADAGNVVGPPTLSATTVNRILANTPMAGVGQVVERKARDANIDDAFALGVWYVETNDGAAGVGRPGGDRNPGSVKGSGGYPVASDGYTIYPSYEVAIADWFAVLKIRYVSRGLTSAYTICYPYVGTSSAATWASKVTNLMVRYKGMEPPPTPTPTPSPTPLDSYHRNYAKYDAEANGIKPPIDRYQEVRPNLVQATPELQAARLSSLSETNQRWLITLTLLAAVLVGALGFRIRQRALQPATDPATGALRPDTFSQWTRSPSAEFSPVQQKSDKVPQVSKQILRPIGLIKHYSSAEMQPRRIVLLPAALAGSENEAVNERHTEGISPYKSVGWIANPAGIASRGLVPRYGDMPEKTAVKTVDKLSGSV